MQRLTQFLSPRNLVNKSGGFAKLALCALVTIATTSGAKAQTIGSGVMQADYRASGLVTPAGMVPPEYHMPYGGVMQVGYTACDAYGSGGCDSSMGGGLFGPAGACNDDCGGTGIFDGMSGCNSGSCGLGSGGLLGGGSCGSCGNGGLFGGCSNGQDSYFGSCCESLLSGVGGVGEMLGGLRPYQHASLCNLRWYDFSAEAVWLTHDLGAGGAPQGVTSDGIGGPIVLGLRDNDVDHEAGVRVSGALIFGPGSNVEMTYMGGHEWDDVQSVSRTTPSLFSFIFDFGTSPNGGFDDTDRSLTQSVAHSSKFHTAEINYRRRSMWPHCRYQSSWLVGLRYLRYDDSLIYTAVGDVNNAAPGNLLRFYSSDDKMRNSLFGPQAGFDFWWNVRPAVSVGFAAKGAWVLNDINRRLILSANSIGPGATPGVVGIDQGSEDTTIMGELQLKMVWRISHSWTLRSAYYGIGVEDIAFGGVDQATSQDFVTGAAVLNQPGIFEDNLFLHGASFGAEYMW